MDANNILFQMPFDESDGATIAYDYSQNRADGVVSGAHFMINFHRLYNARCLFLDFVKIPYLIIHIIFQTL